MKAMVLAAGEGTRLRPLTLTTPKALIPLNGVPLIEYNLLWLKSHGITEVAVNLHHLGYKIREFLGNDSRYGMRITYSEEETILGTAGGVKKLAGFFDDAFVVLYGDVITDFDLSAMVRFHQRKGALATIALVRVKDQSGMGVVQVDRAGRVLSFIEKPPREARVGNLANGGIYVLERAVIDHIPEDRFYDFAYGVLPELLKASLPVYGYRLRADDWLMDIGTPDKYREANEYLKLGKLRLG